MTTTPSTTAPQTTANADPHPGRVFVRNTQHNAWGQGLTLKEAMTRLRSAAGKGGKNIKAEDCTIILHDAERIEVDDHNGAITRMYGGTFRASAYTEGTRGWGCGGRLVQLVLLGGA